MKKNTKSILCSALILSNLLISFVHPDIASAAGSPPNVVGTLSAPGGYADNFTIDGVSYAGKWLPQDYFNPNPATIDVGGNAADIDKVVLVDPGTDTARYEMTLESGTVYKYPDAIYGNHSDFTARNQPSPVGVFKWNRNFNWVLGWPWTYDDDDGVTNRATNDSSIPNDSYGLPEIPSRAPWSTFRKIPKPTEMSNDVNNIVPVDYVKINSVENPAIDDSGTWTPEPSGKIYGISGALEADKSARVNFSELFDYVPADNGHFADPRALYYNYYSPMKIDFIGESWFFRDLEVKVYYKGGSSVLTVTNPGCMDLTTNNSKSLTATYTKPDGTTQDVTSTNTTWSSSSPGVATVSSGGVVTAVSVGTTTIEAHYVDAAAGVDEKGSTSVEVKTSCTNTPPPTDPKCVPTIGQPAKGTIISDSSMDPRSHAVLKADNRGGEYFDVALGIPTSESLYANAFGLNYLFQHKFFNMTGQVTYKVEVTKDYVWSVGGGPGVPPTPMEQRVTQTMTVTRPYSYWQIDNLEVYKLGKSTIINYALGGFPSETVQLDPSGYTAPTLQSDNKDDVTTHVHPAACSGVDLGTGGGPPPGGMPPEFQGAAEGAVGRNQVNNDKVVFTGQTIMENAQHPDQGQTPTTIPQPVEIGQNVLYKNGLVVSNSLVNKANQPTTGKIYYPLISGNIKGGSDKTFDILGINSVTVHTPVVMYPTVTDDQAHNQKVVPTAGRAALILDRPFVVALPTTGQHDAYPGFGGYGKTSGYGDYAKYTARKQVQFEFDVWNADKTQYIPKGTWIDIPVGQINTTFIMPTWIDEGNYTVYFRSISINAPTGFTWETGANFSWPNHVATNTVPVEVIGRIYDFRITDIEDFDWQYVFRTGPNTNTHTQNVYWVGDKDIDGNWVGNRDMNGNQADNSIPLRLPIRPGSHPVDGFKNVTVKKGYGVKFDLKTKGNMFGQKDGIRITPSFYFVNKDGTGRIPVDLYYHDYHNHQYFIKIGSQDDVLPRFIKLNDEMRNVPNSELADTTNYVANKYGVDNFLYLANHETSIGRAYPWEILPWTARTFIGPKSIPSSVDPQRALASIQHWYGEYSIPFDTYVVAAGTDLPEYARTHGGLDDHSPIFLKDGYIIVNFNIESIKNADTSNPFLRYYRLGSDTVPLNNQWQMEGYYNSPESVTDKYGNTFPLMDGDVVFFHADLSSHDDFEATVTH